MPELERHPFARRDEIEPPVTVEVRPHRRGDHAEGLRQLGRDLRGHVGEASAVVPEDVTARGGGVAARREPAADEQIRLAVAVEIAHRHGRGAGQHLR